MKKGKARTKGNVVTRTNKGEKAQQATIETVVRDLQLFMANQEKQIIQHETAETYESIGEHIVLSRFMPIHFQAMGLDFEEAIKFVTMVQEYEPGNVGPYITERYFDMHAQLKEIISELTLENLESRQMVIHFDKLHCFQNIQFLVRGQALVVVTSMRSCNFKTHFVMDSFISYHLGCILADALMEEFKYAIGAISVIMNIGSLHIFKKDVQ